MVTRVAVTTGAPGSAAAFAPTLPTHAAGDRLVLVVTGKIQTTTTPTINQGWTLVGRFDGGTGSLANDTGQMFAAVYAKDAASSSETAPTVTPGGTAPNSWEWICASHRPGAGKQWRDAIAASAAWVQSVSDTSTSSPLTGTVGAWTGVQPTAGDAIFAVGGIPTDLGSALGTTTLTATGLSGGTKTTATSQYVENALGNDTAAVWAGWTGFTGTASAGLATSFTVTSATNQSGVIVGVALREETIPLTPPAAGVVKWFAGDADWDTEGGTTRTVSFAGTAGDKVVVCMASENGTTINPPTIANDGAALTWTTEETLDGGNAQCVIAMFSTTLDTTRTVAVTLTVAANTEAWGVGAWVGGSATGIGASELTHNTSVGSSAPSLGITTLEDNSAIVCINADWNATSGARTYRQVDGANPVEDRYDGVAGSTYIVEAFRYADAGAAGAKTVGMTVPSTQRYVTAAVEIQFAGAATLDGAADLTTTSTLTAGATEENLADAALVTTSTLNATAVRAQPASAALSTTSTLTTTAVRAPQASAALTTTSTLTAAEDRTAVVAAALTTVSTLTATGIQTGTQQASAALVATSTLSATGFADRPAAVALTTASTLTVTAVRQQPASVALTAVSVLTTEAVRAPEADASLTTTSTLAASAVRAVNATVALSTTSTLTVTGLATRDGAAALVTVSTLTATAVRQPQVSAALTAVSTLTAAGVRTAPASASLVTVSTLTANAVGTGFVSASAALVTTSTLTSTGLRIAAVSAALVTVSTLSATGLRTVPVAATFTTVSTLTVASVRIVPSSAALVTVSTLTVTAGAASAAANLSTTSTLTAIAERIAHARVDFIAESTLSVSAGIVRPADADLTTISTLTVGALLTSAASVALVTVSTLGVDATLIPSFIPMPTPPTRILTVRSRNQPDIFGGQKRVVQAGRSGRTITVSGRERTTTVRRDR